MAPNTRKSSGALPGPALKSEPEILAILLTGSENRGTLALHIMSVIGLQDELDDVDQRLDALLEKLDAELGDSADSVSDGSPG